MADNTQVNNGTGDIIRDRDRSGVKTQVMSHDISQAGESELLGLGRSKRLVGTSAGLTTATTVYTSGDQLGTEIAIANAVRTGRGAVIQSAALIDKAKVIGAVDAYLFYTSTTPASDNAPNSWSDADMLNLSPGGVIHFTDLRPSANNYLLLATNLPIVIEPLSTTLYIDLVTQTANGVFGAVGDLQIILGLMQD